jgi:hypothetical protein
MEGDLPGQRTALPKKALKGEVVNPTYAGVIVSYIAGLLQTEGY